MESPHVASPSFIRRSGLLSLALLPCLISLGFQWAGPRPAAQAASAARPALAFDQYAVNLGPISPIHMANGRFRFTNLSDRAVKVTRLTPSCGCLKPRLDKREYAPGESGQFFVHVSTAGEQPGPREYTITMEYEDPEPRKVQLGFRLELPPKQVYVTPRAVLVYTFGAESAEKEILVTDNRDRPISVTGVETSKEFLSATVVESGIDDAGVKKTRIKVLVDPVSAGRHEAIVKIFTDDPKFPELKVPVRVHRQSPEAVKMPQSAAKR